MAAVTPSVKAAMDDYNPYYCKCRYPTVASMLNTVVERRYFVMEYHFLSYLICRMIVEGMTSSIAFVGTGQLSCARVIRNLAKMCPGSVLKSNDTCLELKGGIRIDACASNVRSLRGFSPSDDAILIYSRHEPTGREDMPPGMPDIINHLRETIVVDYRNNGVGVDEPWSPLPTFTTWTSSPLRSEQGPPLQ